MKAHVERTGGHEPSGPYQHELIIKRSNGPGQAEYYWIYVWPYEVQLLVSTLQKFMADGGLKDLHTDPPDFNVNAQPEMEVDFDEDPF